MVKITEFNSNDMGYLKHKINEIIIKGALCVGITTAICAIYILIVLLTKHPLYFLYPK